MRGPGASKRRSNFKSKPINQKGGLNLKGHKQGNFREIPDAGPNSLTALTPKWTRRKRGANKEIAQWVSSTRLNP